ncbi:cysteine desulfurase family protein [Paenibacillus sp. J2TS4]|uniref:cysteine desulfurase family protein n=1 Tax=Paenibacillus sp. J2TS4 TaxID=2807194 RepID=UPI001B25DC08|nr:cysteine desulfurase family protein [Paenibacillus sp. J2TS4]GIP31436.1 cysteine desulfurase [Paenibacillus sp. J2TS4]
MKPIYLDHAATTPMHPAVLEAMTPYFTDVFGNPSSVHSFGRLAHRALNEARERVAAALGCEARQWIWTSGGTESDNLAILGTVAASEGKQHIITSQVEHHAVLYACRYLERQGCEVTYLPVDETGRVDPLDVEQAIRPDTALISIMYGNNEVGTLQPIREIGEIARASGIPFHSDAVQALGLEPVDLSRLPVDLVSFSAHKIEGPKGVGGLYCSPRIRIAPQSFGGSQERKRRAGTENVAGAVGFAAAVERAVARVEHNQMRMNELRRTMIDVWSRELGPQDYVINGHPQFTLSHILNVSFPGVSTETLLMNLDLEGIAAASGSACTSGALEVSHVLQAMKLPSSVTHSAVRFSFGSGNLVEDVEWAASRTAAIVLRMHKK